MYSYNKLHLKKLVIIKCLIGVICMHTCICNIHTNTNTCTRTHTYRHTHTYIHTHILYTHIHTLYTHAWMHMHTYIHTYICMHTHNTHTHIHTHLVFLTSDPALASIFSCNGKCHTWSWTSPGYWTSSNAFSTGFNDTPGSKSSAGGTGSTLAVSSIPLNL